MNRYPKIIAILVLALLSGSLGAQLARAAEPLAHDLHVVLEPGEGTVEVIDKITVTGRDSVTLAIEPWMRIKDLRIDGKVVRYGVPSTSVKLTLPSTGRHRIDVMATGVIPKDGAGRAPGSDPVGGERRALPAGMGQVVRHERRCGRDL